MLIRQITGTLKNRFNDKLFQPYEINFEDKTVGVKLINPTNGNVRENAKLVWYPMENLIIKDIKLNGVSLTTWKEVLNF